MRILSVIIPNKNGEDLLRRFLPQNLQRLQGEAKKIGFRLEVLVIDGDSSDRSREAVNELGAGHCQFISFSGVPSYGAQLNHGVGVATGHFVLILTTDIEIGEGFIEPMINEMESSSDIFSVSPRIQRPLEGGAVESLTRGRFRRNEIEVVRKTDGLQLHRRREIFWPCGAVFLAKRTNFLSLGGFSDEFLPGYSEDVDIGVRAWKQGFRCLYMPQAIAQHWHNSTFKKSGRNVVEFLLVRNHIILNLKHLPKEKKLLFLIKRVVRAIRHRNRLELKSVLSGGLRYWQFRKSLWPQSMTLQELQAVMQRVG